MIQIQRIPALEHHHDEGKNLTLDGNLNALAYLERSLDGFPVKNRTIFLYFRLLIEIR